MLKLGAPIVNTAVDPAATVAPRVEVVEVVQESAPLTQSRSVEGPREYANWNLVLERLGDLKKSLSVQFIGAKAYRMSDTGFLVRMNSFFAQKLASSDGDIMLMRGIIAEAEGLSRDAVSLKIEALGAAGVSDAFSELTEALNK